MKQGHKNTESVQVHMLFKCIKAALAACVLAIILILAFALLLKWEVLNESSINWGNTIIKTICASCAGLLAANNCNKNAWLYAGISGAIFIIASFLAFSIIERTFTVSLALLSDLALGFICGAISAIFFRLIKHAS